MKKVFISYVRENSELIDDLCQAFRENDIDYWLDRDAIAPGAQWPNAIEDAINNGAYFLACFSREYESRDQTNMNEELLIAIDLYRKRIHVEDNAWLIPVKLSECDIPNLPIGAGRKLRHIHCLNLYEDWPGGINRLINTISQSEKNRIERAYTYLGLKALAERAGDFDEMVEIPAGPFWYSTSNYEENIQEPFFIDVSPVTNAQYAKFMIQNGYITKNYWSEEGWDFRKQMTLTTPRYFNKPYPIHPDHPVVGISYFEAEAYAKWAEKKLPTEKEWEKAARGTHGKKYPWGDRFDKTKCNSRESGIMKTTSVKDYPNGKSPYGCYDMAGNVWEWTCSDSQWPEHKVLRGSSWLNDKLSVRCVNKLDFDPINVGIDIGFRCIRSS